MGGGRKPGQAAYSATRRRVPLPYRLYRLYHSVRGRPRAHRLHHPRIRRDTAGGWLGGTQQLYCPAVLAGAWARLRPAGWLAGWQALACEGLQRMRWQGQACCAGCGTCLGGRGGLLFHSTTVCGWCRGGGGGRTQSVWGCGYVAGAAAASWWRVGARHRHLRCPPPLACPALACPTARLPTLLTCPTPPPAPRQPLATCPSPPAHPAHPTLPPAPPQVSVCPGGAASGYTYFLPRVGGGTVPAAVPPGPACLTRRGKRSRQFRPHPASALCRWATPWGPLPATGTHTGAFFSRFLVPLSFVQEETLESRVVTRGYMEAKMVRRQAVPSAVPASHTSGACVLLPPTALSLSQPLARSLPLPPLFSLSLLPSTFLSPHTFPHPSFPPRPQVVALAGRCAERLVLGEANVSTAGAAHLQVLHCSTIQRCSPGSGKPCTSWRAGAAEGAAAHGRQLRPAAVPSCPTRRHHGCPSTSTHHASA